jgi:putative transposase
MTGEKKVWGRKRFALVDTLGLLLGTCVLPADVDDRQGARVLLERLGPRLPRLGRVWADQGFTGDLADWVTERFGWTLEIVVKAAEQRGFVALPKRWRVEQHFGCAGRNRRLTRDLEFWPCNAESAIYIASIYRLLNRLKPVEQ